MTLRTSRDGVPCHVEIFRKALSNLVIAETDEIAAQAVLRVCGFQDRYRPPTYRWQQLPPGLSRKEENARATSAAVMLHARGLIVDLDPDLHDPATDHLLTTSLQRRPPTSGGFAPPTPPTPPPPGR